MPAPSEFALIDRYFTQQAPRSDVALGIGDDCALLIPPTNQQLVVTTDALVSGVHFFPDAPPSSLGHKVLAVSLSDLAAMGATPAWFTLALTLPCADALWLEQFAQGLFTLAQQHQMQLVGGDTTGGALTILTVHAQGFVPPGLALQRSAAQVGDAIYVTGTLGDAGLALAMLRGTATVAAQHRRYLQQRLERPTPRIAQGLALRGLAHAAIDLSDGLAQDLGHILQRSAVGARLEVERLPLSPALRASLTADAAIHMALTAGDDYELCFTVPPSRTQQLEALCRTWDCPCSNIGVISAELGLRLQRADGTNFALQDTGYQHFH